MAKTELAKAYVQIMPSADGIKGKLTEVLGGEAGSAGKNAGASFVGKLKGIIAAAGIGELVKQTLSAGADLQQSFGGLDTIYGDAADAAKKYAMEAAKAGISANDYAEQAVSFGASLKAAFGGDTAKAAEAANKAIMDMTDNAAKMGTPIENLQNAYQGFAKGNYTMLDNLKLGYGGTKTEMERLLADAEKLSGVKYDISNLGDVYDAIHVIQEDLGLTGVAAAEASTTFSGSFGAMKAAATNLMANLALGEDIGPSLEALAESVWNFGINNLLPMVWNIVTGIGTYLYDNRYTFVDSGISAIESFLQGIVDNFPQILETAKGAVTVFLELVTQWLPTVKQKGFEFLGKLINGILDALPGIISSAIEAAAAFLGSLDEKLPELLAKGGEMIANLIRGIGDAIPNVASKIWEIVTVAKDKFMEFDWLQLGKDLIAGLVEGIKAAGGLVLEAIGEVAGGALDWAKNLLGIASPSKVMRDQVGKWIPEGMAAGIKQHSNAVKNAMNELTDTASGSIQTELSMNMRTSGKAFGRTTGGYTQNVYITSPKALSPSEVARQTRNANQQTVLAMRGYA